MTAGPGCRSVRDDLEKETGAPCLPRDPAQTAPPAADTGRPIDGVMVRVYPVGLYTYVAWDYTDGDGHYVVYPALPAGDYQVEFSAPSGYRSEWYSDAEDRNQATAVHVSVGITLTVNGQLSPVASDTGAITGTVTAADTGWPVYCWVYAKDSNGQNIGSDYAGDGRYEISDLPVGVYRVYFSPYSPYVPVYYGGVDDLSAATPVTVTAGVTVANINQIVPLGGVITGVVSDGSSGLPGVYVYAYEVTGGYDSQSTYSGPDGSYRLEGLESGGYRVHFSPRSPYRDEWYDDVRSSTAAQTVSVTVNTVISGINATLETGGIITGRITAADSGWPMAGAYVNVYSATGGLVLSSIYADRDGYYRTPGLPDGHYRVIFWPGDWRFYASEWYGGVHDSGDSPTITVTASDVVTGIDGLLDRYGSISGVVRDENGHLPLSSVYVVVYSATNMAFVGSDYTSSWGLYQVRGLPDGEYKVRFSKTGYETRWYSDAADSDAALTVTIRLPAAPDLFGIDALLGWPYHVYLPCILRN